MISVAMDQVIDLLVLERRRRGGGGGGGGGGVWGGERCCCCGETKEDASSFGVQFALSVAHVNKERGRCLFSWGRLGHCTVDLGRGLIYKP